jgi:hypothetical protein
MLKEIIKECIKDMLNDKMLLFTLDLNQPLDVKSYKLQKLGNGSVYCCETDLSNKVLYVEQSRVNKKIEEKRNKRIDDVLNRQGEI